MQHYMFIVSHKRIVAQFFKVKLFSFYYGHIIMYMYISFILSDSSVKLMYRMII